MRIPDVDWSEKLFAVHQSDQSFDLIIDVTETSGLGTIAVNCDWFFSYGFEDEVADNSTVELVQSGTVSIENSCDSDVNTLDSVVLDEKSFRCSFTLIVARPDSNGVDMAPIIFTLRTDFWVTVDFWSWSEEYSGFVLFGKIQNVDRALETSEKSFEGGILVVNGWGGTGQIIDLLGDKINGDFVSDVGVNKFKFGVVNNVLDVPQVTCHEIIDADNFMSFLDKTIAEMRSNKSTASGD